jgi:O-antigen ligase/tetratricopeptide (TPR) repeat protein
LDRQRLLAASLGIAFFLIPAYPAFIGLTGAPIPGVVVIPRPLTIALLALAALLAAWWIAELLRAPKAPMPTVLAVAAFPAAGLVAALVGFDPLAGALFVAILAGGVVWHAAILRFARDEATLTTIFGAYLLSGALASLAAIVMLLAQTPVALYTIGHGRATGTFVLPGELAGYLVVYVPVAFAVGRAVPRLRTLALLGFALGAAAFALTFSRAGYLGMAAAIAAFVLIRRRERGVRYAVGIMGLAIVVVGLAFNAHHDPSENFTRLSIWHAALAMARDFPLSGTGPFEFPRLYQTLRDPGGEPLGFHAHNVVLTIAAETGLIGLAAVLFGWWRFARELRARLRGDGPFTTVAAAIAAGLIGTWVQGLIDTSSIVVFALWLPFMALALVCAGDGPNMIPSPNVILSLSKDDAEPARPSTRRHLAPGRRIAFAAAVVLIAAACAFMQVASSALYSPAAVPGSLPARLGALGPRPYEAIERIAPLPFVEAALAQYALDGGAVARAAAHATRVPPGAVRSDLQARIAEARGHEADAIRDYLDAGDDEALQRIVYAKTTHGRPREAHELERRIRDRLISIGLRPDDVADSWWRLGVLAERLGDDAEAGADYANASRSAPLNTKYLFDAGLSALHRGDATAAGADFTAITRIDPADADAVAGLGFAAVLRGDRDTAARFSARADAINPGATFAQALAQLLPAWKPADSSVPNAFIVPKPAHDTLAPQRTGAE